MTKNADSDKYSYSGYGFGFDAHLAFSMSSGDGFGKSSIIFGVNNSSSPHADNRQKDISIPGKGHAEGLDDTTVTAEAKFCINFTKQEMKFCAKSTQQW